MKIRWLLHQFVNNYYKIQFFSSRKIFPNCLSTNKKLKEKQFVKQTWEIFFIYFKILRLHYTRV